MTFPEGTEYGIWFPVREGEDWRIKRMASLPDGTRKPQRLKRSTYAHIANTRLAMQTHCDRLNFGRNMARLRQIEIVSAFLPNRILNGFHDELRAVISASNRQYADFLFNRVTKEYFLDFFINHLNLPDPRTWAAQQTTWGLSLTSNTGQHQIFEEPASVRSIKLTIQTANRFLRYLHQQMPDEYPLIKLNPVSKAVLKNYRATIGEEPVGQFVTDAHWTELQRHLTADIRPYIHLMYYYGLRRSESLGFQEMNAVRNNYLFVTHQLLSLGDQGQPSYGPLKSREQRKTPHWFITVEEAFAIVRQSIAVNDNHKMHPDTLSEKWEQLMTDLGWTYHLHDFRRTFITRALRTQNPRDVQLAVGHTDLRTTMGYAQDDRNLGDEVFVPRPA